MRTTLTIEQSARLIELGVEKKLANVCADVPDCDKPEWNDPNAIDILESQCVFSLESLLAILPKKITAKRATYILEFGVCTNPDNWYVKYKHERTNSTLYDLWAIRGELIDAIYEILLKIKGKRYKIQEL